MKTPFEPLEKHLRSFTPRSPSAAVKKHIADATVRGAARRPGRRAPSAAGLPPWGWAAAAALVILLAAGWLAGRGRPDAGPAGIAEAPAPPPPGTSRFPAGACWWPKTTKA